MYPLIPLGSVAVPTSTVAWIAALWIGTYLANRECQRRRVAGRDDMWNAVTIAVVSTAVVGRLAYVARNFSAFSNDLVQIALPAPASLSLDVGIVSGLVAALAYIQRRKIPLVPFLDTLAPSAFVAVAIVATGQWTSGDVNGTLSDVPWAMSLGGELRHPVQLYEAIGVLFGWIVVTRIARTGRVPDGLIIACTIAWYSATRLVVDAFRDESALLPGGYRSAQVVALIVLLVSLGIMARISETKHARAIAGSIPGRRD